MKMKTAIMVLMICISSALIAQEQKQETLFQSESLLIGAYGGPELKVSTLDGNVELFTGGRGGVILNNTFSIGGVGYGLVTTNEFSITDNNVRYDYEFDMDYGGLYLEYIYASNSAFHFTLHSLIGGGQASIENDARGNEVVFTYDRTSFFVFEPGINMEMNLTKIFRINLGGSYRFVVGSSMDMGNYTDSNLSGFSINLALKFGLFNGLDIPNDIIDAIEDIKDEIEDID